MQGKIHPIFILVASISVGNVNAASCVQNNNQVGLVGMDSANGNVFAQVSGHDNGCSCPSFRFKAINTDNKIALSILLAAKVAGKEVRVDVADSQSCDTAYRVYLQ